MCEMYFNVPQIRNSPPAPRYLNLTHCTSLLDGMVARIKGRMPLASDQKPSFCFVYIVHCNGH